jgi:hypothetical protein
VRSAIGALSHVSERPSSSRWSLGTCSAAACPAWAPLPPASPVTRGAQDRASARPAPSTPSLEPAVAQPSAATDPARRVRRPSAPGDRIERPAAVPRPSRRAASVRPSPCCPRPQPVINQRTTSARKS